MNIQLKMQNNMPCEVESFIIDGKIAKVEDFGRMFSHKTTCDACLNFGFEKIPYGRIISKKYKLTEEEYYDVCDFLKNNTYIESCSKCFKYSQEDTND